MNYFKAGAIVFFGLLLLTLGSCKVLKSGNPEKKALKQKQKEDELMQEAYRQEIKHHYKMQSTETRKRMKQNYAKVRRHTKKQSSSYWRCN